MLPSQKVRKIVLVVVTNLMNMHQTYLIGSALICCSNIDIVASRSPGGGTGTPTPRAIPPTPTPQCAGKLMALLMFLHFRLPPPGENNVKKVCFN